MTWPWKGDTATDRARRVAQAYRQILAQVEPEAAAQLDARFTGWGEAWVAPVAKPMPGMDAWVSVSDAAALVGRSVKTIYAWIELTYLPVRRTESGIRVRVRDLHDTHRELRLRRSG